MSTSSSGRKPDFRVAAMDKRRDMKNGRIGAGWLNEDGSISITLDPFISLQGRPELLITLFPANAYEESLNRKPRRDPSDIPF